MRYENQLTYEHLEGFMFDVAFDKVKIIFDSRICKLAN